MSSNTAQEPITGRLPVADQPLVVFTCFSSLPPELRREVWSHAASFPRIVALRGGVNHLYETGSHCALERVNKEAHGEIQRSRNPFYDPINRPSAPKIYVNLEVDTILFYDCVRLAPGAETSIREAIKNVQNLAIYKGDFESDSAHRLELFLAGLSIKTLITILNRAHGDTAAEGSLALFKSRGPPRDVENSSNIRLRWLSLRKIRNELRDKHIRSTF